MTASAYRISNRTWVEAFFWRGKFSSSLAFITIFAAIPWLTGLMIAHYTSQTQRYIGSEIFVVASVGIFVTTSFILYGSRRQYEMYDSFFDCFELQIEQKRSEILRIIESYSNSKRLRKSISVAIVLASILLVWGFIGWNQLNPQNFGLSTTFPRFSVFEREGWYLPGNQYAGLAITLSYVPWIAAPLATATRIISRMTLHIYRARRLTPRYPPMMIKAHFKRISQFYVIVGLGWLSGSALLFFLIGTNADLLSLGVASVPIILGIVTMLTPQVTYLTIAEKSNEMASAAIKKGLQLHSEEFNAAISSHWDRTSAVLQTLKFDNWVYPVHQTYLVIATYVLAGLGYLNGWSIPLLKF